MANLFENYLQLCYTYVVGRMPLQSFFEGGKTMYDYLTSIGSNTPVLNPGLVTIKRNNEILFVGKKKDLSIFFEQYGSEKLAKTNPRYFLQIFGEAPYIYETVENIVKYLIKHRHVECTLNNGMIISF